MASYSAELEGRRYGLSGLGVAADKYRIKISGNAGTPAGAAATLGGHRTHTYPGHDGSGATNSHDPPRVWTVTSDSDDDGSHSSDFEDEVFGEPTGGWPDDRHRAGLITDHPNDGTSMDVDILNETVLRRARVRRAVTDPVLPNNNTQTHGAPPTNGRDDVPDPGACVALTSTSLQSAPGDTATSSSGHEAGVGHPTAATTVSTNIEAAAPPAGRPRWYAFGRARTVPPHVPATGDAGEGASKWKALALGGIGVADIAGHIVDMVNNFNP